MIEPEMELVRTNLRRWTFQAPKMKEWVENNSSGIVLNLFAGKTELDLNEIRNDIDVDMPANFHMDAFEFVTKFKGAFKFDTVILDSPYSYRKAMEMYKGNYTSKFKLIADELPRITKPDAKIISFGYHSTFMGQKRGYDLVKMCVFAHGGAQHCTIGIIEQRTADNVRSDEEGTQNTD